MEKRRSFLSSAFVLDVTAKQVTLTSLSDGNGGEMLRMKSAHI